MYGCVGYMNWGVVDGIFGFGVLLGALTLIGIVLVAILMDAQFRSRGGRIK